jgi:hypothetical protein
MLYTIVIAAKACRTVNNVQYSEAWSLVIELAPMRLTVRPEKKLRERAVS